MSTSDPSAYEQHHAQAIAAAQQLRDLQAYNRDLEINRGKEATARAIELFDMAAHVATIATTTLRTNFDLTETLPKPGRIARLRGLIPFPTITESGWLITEATSGANGLVLTTDGLLSTYKAIPNERRVGMLGVKLDAADRLIRKFSFKGFDNYNVSAPEHLVLEQNVNAIEYYFTKFVTKNSTYLKPN